MTKREKGKEETVKKKKKEIEEKNKTSN